MTFLSALTTRRSIFACAFAIGTIAPATSAFAQRANLMVNVPFPFQEGSHSFPAGVYHIQETSANMLLVRSKTGDQIKIVMALEEICPKAPSSGRLVFHKYGDRYFLSDIWQANSTVGRQMIVSRAEKELRGTPTKRRALETQVALNVPQP